MKETILQSLQEKARKTLTYHITQEDAPVFTPDVLDELIADTVTTLLTQIEGDVDSMKDNQRNYLTHRDNVINEVLTLLSTYKK